MTPDPLFDLTGKIALIKRGTCNFEAKLNNAQAAGAAGMGPLAVGTDGGVQSVMDIETHFFEIEAKEIDIYKFTADLAAHFGVLDTVFDCLPLLSRKIHHRDTESTEDRNQKVRAD